ncbi:hypothetical protein [Polaribacter sejongensis]|uniref:hypothetical protein n=1 Tax=Polaribacter sejongensis TaxID=985043 RepID=UPI002674FACB|nr:hypothetical protein [Polaribacter sejongensis]
MRAIIEAIKCDSTINKIYLQKGLRGELFYELNKLVKTWYCSKLDKILKPRNNRQKKYTIISDYSANKKNDNLKH